MSSYLSVYVRHKDNVHVTELICVSRSSEIYQNISEQCNPIFVDRLDCKEWYEWRKHEFSSLPFKYVKTKAEAIEPIPENAEYEQQRNDFFSKKIDKITAKPAYQGYFIQEEYDNLPSKDEMVISKATEIKESDIDAIIADLKEQIKTASDRVYQYKLYLINKEEYLLAVKDYFEDESPAEDAIINEVIEWENYIKELTEVMNYFEFLGIIINNDNTLYCYVD